MRRHTDRGLTRERDSHRTHPWGRVLPVTALVAVLAATGVVLTVREVREGIVLAPSGSGPAAVPTTSNQDSSSRTLRIEVSVEVVSPTGDIPFTVSSTDPGHMRGHGTTHHHVVFTPTAGPVELHDLNLSGILTDGEGQLAVSSGASGPHYDEATGQPGMIGFGGSPVPLRVAADTASSVQVGLWADPALVGPKPLLPGAYVLESPVRWSPSRPEGGTAGPSPNRDPGQGSGVIRLRYRVSEAPEAEDAQPLHIGASVSIVDSTVEVPFTVSITDPGEMLSTGRTKHTMTVTAIDEVVYVEGMRFGEVLRDGNGILLCRQRYVPALPRGCWRPVHRHL